MKKWILYLLPVLIFAGCNKGELDKDTREKMNAAIVDYLVEERIGNAKVEIDEYSKVDLPLKDIREYARLKDSLNIYIQRYEELELHESEGGHLSVSPMILSDEEKQKCDGHDRLIEEYGGMIASYKYRISELEKKYTQKNYIAKTILQQGKIGKCTPVWFYFDNNLTVMTAYFFNDEIHTCY